MCLAYHSVIYQVLTCQNLDLLLVQKEPRTTPRTPPGSSLQSLKLSPQLHTAGKKKQSPQWQLHTGQARQAAASTLNATTFWNKTARTNRQPQPCQQRKVHAVYINTLGLACCLFCRTTWRQIRVLSLSLFVLMIAWKTCGV